MVEAKLDRRVQKTRLSLENALIVLILEKGYDAVKVQDLLDRANIGRSTFYAHYQDKEALLMSRFEGLQKAFEEHFQMVVALGEAKNEEGKLPVNLPLFMLRYVENEHQLFKALLGKRSSGRHVSLIENFLLKYTRDVVKTYASAPLSRQQLEIVVHYLTSAFISLLIWWVDGDMPCSAEELYTILMRLMEPGLKDVLE